MNNVYLYILFVFMYILDVFYILFCFIHNIVGCVF